MKFETAAVWRVAPGPELRSAEAQLGARALTLSSEAAVELGFAAPRNKRGLLRLALFQTTWLDGSVRPSERALKGVGFTAEEAVQLKAWQLEQVLESLEQTAAERRQHLLQVLALRGARRTASTAAVRVLAGGSGPA